MRRDLHSWRGTRLRLFRGGGWRYQREEPAEEHDRHGATRRRRWEERRVDLLRGQSLPFLQLSLALRVSREGERSELRLPHLWVAPPEPPLSEHNERLTRSLHPLRWTDCQDYTGVLECRAIMNSQRPSANASTSQPLSPTRTRTCFPPRPRRLRAHS